MNDTMVHSASGMYDKITVRSISSDVKQGKDRSLAVIVVIAAAFMGLQLWVSERE